MSVIARGATGLTGGAAGDLDAIVAKYQSIGQTTAKLLFMVALEDWAMLAEQRIGITTEAIFDARVNNY